MYDAVVIESRSAPSNTVSFFDHASDLILHPGRNVARPSARISIGDALIQILRAGSTGDYLVRWGLCIAPNTHAQVFPFRRIEAGSDHKYFNGLVLKSICGRRVSSSSATWLPLETIWFVLRSIFTIISYSYPATVHSKTDHVSPPFMLQVPMRDSVHQLQTNAFKATSEIAKYGVQVHKFVSTRPLDNSERSALATNDSSDIDLSIPENRPDIDSVHAPSNVSDIDLPGKGIFWLNAFLFRPK